MTDFVKALLILIALAYVISPIDACPGPIDDVIVLLLALTKGDD